MSMKRESDVTLTDFIMASLVQGIDWTTIQVPDEEEKHGCHIDVASSAARQALILGGALGAQFAGISRTIIGQEYGVDEETQYEKEKNQIEDWMRSRDDVKQSETVFENIGNLKAVCDRLENGGVEWITQHQVGSMLFGYFLHGCVFGELHTDFFLDLLEASIEKENHLFEALSLGNVSFPPEFANRQSLEGSLEMARELLEGYESAY